MGMHSIDVFRIEEKRDASNFIQFNCPELRIWIVISWIKAAPLWFRGRWCIPCLEPAQRFRQVQTQKAKLCMGQRESLRVVN